MGDELIDLDDNEARELIAEVKRLRAEVERDANTIEQCGLEICELREALEKIERGGPWDSQAIARAALHTEEPSARAGGADPK
jgi:hypothetical protein